MIALDRATRLVGLLLGAGLFLSPALAATSAPLQLQLHSKNPTTWQSQPQGGQADLWLDLANGDFRLSATSLQPHQHYGLICHNNQGRASRGYWLASGRSDAAGNLQLNGRWHLWQAKVWLVLADDLTGRPGDQQPDGLRRWRPQDYLFESRQLPLAALPVPR